MTKPSDIYKQIEIYKTNNKKVTYTVLGEIVSMTSDQFRMALKRKSLSDLELKTLNDYISPTKNEQNFAKNDKQLFKSIPFYDINISAGDITFLDDGLIKDQEPDDWFDIPKSIDADIAFPTYGHSMTPVITNGDRVAYKFITDWSFFNYGMKYLIVTEEQRMVKYLRKHEKEGYILLESENPEYDPIDMPLSSVRNILQVRYIGKIEM